VRYAFFYLFFYLRQSSAGVLLVIAFVVIVLPPDCSTGLFYFILVPNRRTVTHLLHGFFSVYLICPSCPVHRQHAQFIRTREEPFTSPHSQRSLLSYWGSQLYSPAIVCPIPHKLMFLKLAFMQVAWYVVLGLYASSTFIAVTTPLGPALHFPVSRIYSEKTVAAITNQAMDNVSGVTGSCFLFNLTIANRGGHRRVSLGPTPFLVHHQSRDARQHLLNRWILATCPLSQEKCVPPISSVPCAPRFPTTRLKRLLPLGYSPGQWLGTCI
jgi:hypothetical protein